MLGPLALALLLSAPQGHAMAPMGAVRLEHFVLEEQGEEGPRPVGVIALRRITTPTGILLEQEVIFRESGLRILIDECHDLTSRAPSPQLIWRELRSSPTTGRTWLAEWDRELGAVTTANHGTRAPVHGVLPGPRPLFPLSLIEALRGGALLTQVESLDALGRSRVHLDVLHGSEGERRHTELRREDGSLAARYVFEGDHLVEVQLQEGRRIGRPCERAQFELLSGRWRVRYEPLEGLRALARRPRAVPR